MTREQRGLGLGLGAYGLWGLFPLYWPLLKPAGAVELIAHRAVWSLLLLIGFQALRRRGKPRPAGDKVRAPVAWGRIALAALTLSFNLGIYVYGVNNGRVVEAALGYFIAPLVMIGAGVLVLGERLRTAQTVAVVLGMSAVLVLVTAYGRVPWLALALAGSWAVYGYLKKTVDLPAMPAMTIETAAMFVPAVAFLAWLAWHGTGTFVTGGAGHSLLLTSSGLAVVPLLMFAAAARRVPLTTLGMLQYLEPAMQFGVGVVVRHEPMPIARWLGFGFVWAALILLMHDAKKSARPA